MREKNKLRDVFGHWIWLKRWLISLIGFLTYRRYHVTNKLKVENAEILQKLPAQNVLFLSNHQTYYADVIAFYHIFCSQNACGKMAMQNLSYLLRPKANIYYVAAEETMKKSGLIPRIFAYVGAVTVRRSWRSEGTLVQRKVDKNAFEQIEKALSAGWLVSFPQGTTSPYAPVRKGVAHIIRDYQPIVVPIEIDGFRRAFDKKGFFLKQKNTVLKVKFKAPMQYDSNDSVDNIKLQIKKAIGQNKPNLSYKKRT
ncbi:MAG: 1-acyl-sn-glycerol-3-phosphate acyltransferase [Bernardetiaceae bacterium]|nr:1-acyl-sn-glycerol-3-phosphate acyltransferase [Bernardetiaceae bacterium]